jgi:hypothetical protein
MIGIAIALRVIDLLVLIVVLDCLKHPVPKDKD